MSDVFTRSFAVSCLAAMLMTAPAVAQPAPQQAPAKQEEFTPRPGQPGKDVIWLPTAQGLVDRMLDMARVTVDDYVVDLGSGDGRTVITAAKRGAKAHGIEYNPNMVEFSRRAAETAGVNNLATFAQGDIFESNFSDATVVTLFLLPDLNIRLRPTLLEMKPGTRVVSNSFNMGDWTPDDRISAGGSCTSHCQAFFWIVPAKVAGTWRLPEGELTLEQKYQMLTGTLRADGRSVPITGKMEGDKITFNVGDRIYRGRVNGNAMEGVFATEAKWQAKRG
jgi:hypothetical protein